MKEAVQRGPACSLSLHRMRGEGWGEGCSGSPLASPPLIRPAATFSPPPRKGEGARGSLWISVRTHVFSLAQRERAGVREKACEVAVAATGLKARHVTAWGGASSASAAPGSCDPTPPALKGRPSVTPFQGVLPNGPGTWASGALRALQPRLSSGRLSALSYQLAASLTVCIHVYSRDSRANSSLT